MIVSHQPQQPGGGTNGNVALPNGIAGHFSLLRFKTRISIAPLKAWGRSNSKQHLARAAKPPLSLLTDIAPHRGRAKAFMRGFSRQCGHSMVEVIMAMSILSGVTALAVPEISRLLASVRLRSAMLSITDGLRLARAEAIRRNGRVVMCKSADGKQCTKAGDWGQGWIVFHDFNNSGKVESLESVLYREPPASELLRMTGNDEIEDFVSYASYGKAKQLNGAFQAGTFTVCAHSVGRTAAYKVIFGILGRPRVERTSVPNCL